MNAATQAGNNSARQLFEEHLTLLRRCQEIGITAAFAEKLNIPPEALAASQTQANLEIPPQFQPLIQQAMQAIQQYQATGQRLLLDQAVTAWEQILQDADFPRTRESFQLAIMNEAGGARRRRYWAQGQIPDLNRALELWQTAVAAPPDSPALPGYLNNLGNGLRDRYARTGQLADLEEAIRVYDQALRFLDVQFLLSPVSFQLGPQRNWAGLFARAVVAHLDAHQPQTALAVAEGSNSRLLASLLGRGQLPAPLGIPLSLAQQEQALAAQLNALDAAALAQHGASAGSGEDGALAQRQQLVSQLQQLWSEMSTHGVEAQEYITLRRGDRPAGDDLAAWPAACRQTQPFSPSSPPASKSSSSSFTLTPLCTPLPPRSAWTISATFTRITTWMKFSTGKLTGKRAARLPTAGGSWGAPCSRRCCPIWSAFSTLSSSRKGRCTCCTCTPSLWTTQAVLCLMTLPSPPSPPSPC